MRKKKTVIKLGDVCSPLELKVIATTGGFSSSGPGDNRSEGVRTTWHWELSTCNYRSHGGTRTITFQGKKKRIPNKLESVFVSFSSDRYGGLLRSSKTKNEAINQAKEFAKSIGVTITGYTDGRKPNQIRRWKEKSKG